MIDSKTEQLSLCSPDHVLDRSSGWTYSWMTRGTETERARKTARNRERGGVLTVKLPQAYQWAFNRPPLTTKTVCVCVCVCTGKGGRDSNEGPVSCISGHSSALTFTPPAPHLETRASQTRHLTRCHLTCWYGEATLSKCQQKLWRSEENKWPCRLDTAAKYESEK